MKNHKLLTLRVISKQAGPYFDLSKKLLRKQKLLKMTKSLFSGPK